MVEIGLFGLLCHLEILGPVSRRNDIPNRHGYLFRISALKIVDIKVRTENVGAIYTNCMRALCMPRRGCLEWSGCMLN